MPPVLNKGLFSAPAPRALGRVPTAPAAPPMALGRVPSAPAAPVVSPAAKPFTAPAGAALAPVVVTPAPKAIVPNAFVRLPSSSVVTPAEKAFVPPSVAALAAPPAVVTIKRVDPSGTVTSKTPVLSTAVTASENAGYVPPPAPAPVRDEIPAPAQAYQDAGGGGQAYQAPAEEAWTPPEEPSTQSANLAPVSRSAPPVASSAMVLASNAAPLKAPSFVERVLAFFRGLFGGSSKPATMGAETDRAAMAGAVVRRARNGDQNAMAILALVRDNAKAGQLQAKVSLKLIEDYIRANPVGTVGFAGDEKATNSAASILSLGPKLDAPAVTDLMNRACKTHGERDAFAAGVRGDSAMFAHPALTRAHKMGVIVRDARAVQALKSPNVRISDVDSVIGWELGD